MKIKKRKIIIGIFTIILIILMFYFVDFRLILENISKISVFGIILFLMLYTFAILWRTFRLKLTFQGLNSDTTFLNLLGSFGVAWGITEILPGRVGEVARVEFIRQKENELNVSKTLCGITIEKFIDLLVLLLISSLALFIMYFNNIKGTTELNLHIYIVFAALLLIGGSIVILILFFKTSWFLNIVDKFSKKLRNLLEIFLKDYLGSMNDFRKNKKKGMTVGVFSLFLWIIETFPVILLFYLLGLEINFFIIIAACTILFLSKAFPITPGGWVISESLAALFIYLFYPSIPLNVLLSVFILDHILKLVYNLSYGVISISAFNFELKKVSLLFKKNEEVVNL